MHYLYKYKRSLITGLLIGFTVIAVLLFLADFKDVARVFSAINLKLLPLILLLAPFNYFFRFLKWNYYLKIFNIEPDPKLNRYIFMSGLSMTITPGKVGELLKCYLMKEHVGAPVSQTSSIVMAERVTDALAMVILASLGFLAYPYGRVLVPFFAGIVLFLIVIFHFDSLFNVLTASFIKISIFKKGAAFLHNFQRSAKKLFSTRNLLVGVGIGIISWGFEGFVVFLAVKALGGEISVLGSFFVVSLSSLLGAISFLPGGLGVAEGSIMAILMLSGMGKEMAAATTVITRFSTLWLGVGVGIVGLILTQRELIKNK